MSRKLLTVLLILTIICAFPFSVLADITPPKTLGAPEHFGVSHYYGGSLHFTFSAPEDLRTYIEERAADDPDNKQSFSPHFQIDYKIDNGSWHYTSDWDSPKTAKKNRNNRYLTFVNGKSYTGSDRWSMTELFDEDEAIKSLNESGWDYFNSHSITFRVRFAESFDYGETYVLSPWSKEYTLSAKAKADYDKLINYAPTLISVELKATPSGEPYFDVKLGRHPKEIKDLHAMAGGSVRTEIWMRRAGDKDFKYIHYKWADTEVLRIEASDYFSVDGSKQSYDAESYEIKARYSLDLDSYKQSGRSDDIFGPFSNVISHNMPAWSEASAWAMGELKKADDYGLIPDSLKGADMTKPITREEFAELAVKLYEKTTDTKAAAASPNPFADTSNPEILKAFKLGITTGTSATTFAPKDLTNREQVATMLSRAIRVMAPDGDFSTDGAPSFTDQKDISSWALEHVKFMSKNGIIKGADGKFMPKATTTAQSAAGYATTTREQAIAMSVRSYEQFKDISTKTPTESSTKPSQPSAETHVSSTKTGVTQSPEPEKSNEEKDLAEWLIGTWGYSDSNGLSLDYILITDNLYEFREDGTFHKIVSSMWSGFRSGTEYTGNYRVSGNKLILYNQLKSTGDAYTTEFNKIWYIEMGKYDTKDVQAENSEYIISRTDDDMLKIDDTKYVRGK